MIRVASYCRVSTDHSDQVNSFEAQKRYFEAYISGNPDWELYCIYADAGITGTSTKKRVQFNRMIADAYCGRFQLIVTKEVSRFSRNILDTISYTRELRKLGIAVLFLSDGINTMDADAELRLSIMASIAQEESRRTSERVKWGQTRQMERGVVFGHSMLGYEVKNGVIRVEPEGAELVRLIYQKYGIEKKGISVIARELQEAGYRTYSGNPRWSSSHILKILKNEKYVGDLVQKKSYTPDFLTHEKKINHGEEELVILYDHHEAIVERALWEQVQKEIARRNRHSGSNDGRSVQYSLSGKIKCGECGSAFVARRRVAGGKSILRWSCRKAGREGCRRSNESGVGIGCDVGMLLRDDVADELVEEAFLALKVDLEAIVKSAVYLALKGVEPGQREGEKLSHKKLESSIAQTDKKREIMLDAYFSGEITYSEMKTMKERYEGQLTRMHQELRQCQLEEDGTRLKQLYEEAVRILSESDRKMIFKEIVDRIIVYKDRHIELKFCGLPHVFHFG